MKAVAHKRVMPPAGRHDRTDDLAAHTATPAVRLCIPDEQLQYLPPYGTVPSAMPAGSVVPRKGEIVYLSSTSAWTVSLVIHEFLPGGTVRIEVWLEWVGSARHARDPLYPSTH